MAEKTRGKKKILSIISVAVLVLLFALVVVLFFGKVTGKTVFIGNKTVMWVMTESMEDEIPAQTYIVVSKTDVKTLEVGDVISFYSSDPMLNGAINTHRITEIIGDHEEFKTMGDNNAGPDKYTVKAENVVGKYERKLPVLTFFGRLLMSPVAIIVIIVAVIGTALASTIPEFKKFAREEKAAKENFNNKEEERKRNAAVLTEEEKAKIREELLKGEKKE